MSYIDGYIFTLSQEHLELYTTIAEQVATIWKEHGALEYSEFIGDDLSLEGTRSFVDLTQAKEDEIVVFGWVTFPSKEIRDQANKTVPTDKRMNELVAPLVQDGQLIFDASTMVYGGFKPLVKSQ